MKKLFNKFASISFLIITLFTFPVKGFSLDFNHINNLFLVSQQNTNINYEKSQPSSIENPVIDPNFNVMRSAEAKTSNAVYIVVGLIFAAAIIPLATFYFSKQS
tara:strand:+ start:7359 stop:7670 length:312 start_codon:yes stop_codon:yes gene_type:complete